MGSQRFLFTCNYCACFLLSFLYHSLAYCFLYDVYSCTGYDLYDVFSNLISTNILQDFHKARMSRTSMFPATAYNPPEDSLSQDVIATVEKSMKKYADNLMRFLEGISSRLSQLELYCYNLDKSIGEMRSDLTRDHVEQDSRLKSLEKHLQEVSHYYN